MYRGMLYFPLKVNLFEEIAVELVEARFGLKGTAAVMKLLCKIHKENGYYGGGNETAVQDTQGKRILPEMERGAMHTVHKQGGKGHQRAGDAGNRGHPGGESLFRPQNL